jgi:hypothetical protein
MLRFTKVLCLSVLALFFAAPSLCHAQQAMDNAAVMKLKSAGLSDDLIVQTINASQGHYDTTTDSMIQMKKDGLSDGVIGAMVAKNANPNGPAAGVPQTIILAAPPPAVPGVTDVGVYYKTTAGQWDDVLSENVNFKTGGVLKSAFTDGIVKGDLNGHLTGPAAKLGVTNGTDFIIYVMEGQTAGDYQLLHMHTHKDGREFRSVTGGVFHQSGGAERDTVTFEAKKIAPRIYQLTLPAGLPKGEYGFLPPMTMNTGKNMASQGKMYTFSVTE